MSSLRPDPFEQRVVHGSAMRHSAPCLVAAPRTADEARALLAVCAERGLSIVPRGHGCSYTGNTLNAGNVVLDMRGLDRITAFDPSSGLITVECGVSMAAILDRALPFGWMLGGVPGSPGVTVGGAIANNVHGKDSYLAGTFARAVVSLTVLGADGEARVLTRSGDTATWFDFVVAGMGLTGIILDATIQLRRVAGPLVDSRTLPCRDLAEMADMMEAHKDTAELMLGWVDAFSSVGRGCLELGTFVPDDTGAGYRAIDGRPQRFHGVLPTGLLYPVVKPFMGAVAMRVHNELKFRGDARRPRVLTDLGDHAFPLAFTVPDFVQLFPGGLVEAQVLLPMDRAVRVHGKILSWCRDHSCQSWVCAMKRFSADDFPMSFAGDGISLTYAVPGRRAARRGFTDFYRRLTDLVADSGGRVNLTKDEMLRPADIRGMYPALDRFLAFKQGIDPDGRFDSAFLRRLMEA